MKSDAELRQVLRTQHQAMIEDAKGMLKDNLGITGIEPAWDEKKITFAFTFDALFFREPSKIVLEGGGGYKRLFFWEIKVFMLDESRSKANFHLDSPNYEKVMRLADYLHNWMVTSLKATEG